MPARIFPSPTTAPLSSNTAGTPTWRDAFVDAAAFSAIAVVAINETLSAFGWLSPPGVLLGWTIAAIGLVGWFLRKGSRPELISKARIPELDREDWYYIAFMAFICLATLYVALAGQPNAYDSLSYHLPRLLRWAQDRTLDFYPTHNQRQLWIGPGWEYFAIQLKLIARTDALVSLVQWVAMVASPVVASLVARELGAGRRGQLLAALFTLSIPMGISQGSGAQVDLFSGFWLAVSVALLLRIKRLGIAHARAGNAILLGASAGMAVLSKATCFLFLLPFILWVGWSLIRDRPLRFATLGLLSITIAAAINAGHLVRNNVLYGSPLGIRGSQGVTNEAVGPRILASNILRNAVLHLNTPSDRLNARMTAAITSLHARAGLDVSDPRTTFSRWKFEVPPEWDDEGLSTNQQHFLIIVAVTTWLTLTSRRSAATRYLWCVFAGALLFCVVLKWQPWHSRLQLPLFVISGAAIGAALEKKLSRKHLKWVAAALALTALHPTFRNVTRPLIVRRPLFTRSFEERLLPDGSQAWKVYATAADAIASRGCSRIGLISDHGAWEYPVWKLIERRSGVTPEIRHVGVTNVSRLTESQRDRSFKPCAVMVVDYFVPLGREELVRRPRFPEGIPKVPPGFVPAWKQKFITIYLPAGA